MGLSLVHVQLWRFLLCHCALDGPLLRPQLLYITAFFSKVVQAVWRRLRRPAVFARCSPLWPRFTELQPFMEEAFSDPGKLKALVSCYVPFTRVHRGTEKVFPAVPSLEQSLTSILLLKASFFQLAEAHAAISPGPGLCSPTVRTIVLRRWPRPKTTFLGCPPAWPVSLGLSPQS